MAIVDIPVQRITDWDSFHTVFAEVLGFPGFYERNMDAWIDCVRSADDPGAGLMTLVLPPGEFLTLDLGEVSEFRRRCPAQYDALVACVGWVNASRIDVGRPPIVAVAFR